jgi:glycosyltransferase involved in cell wall biosynthesis
MKIALVCPASLPATQFGGILFLCVDIAKELARIGHDITIYTTDLDFSDNDHTFNKKLPRLEKINGFKIRRSHVYARFSLYYINPGIFLQLKNNKPDIIHTVGIRSFQSLIAALVSKFYGIPLVVSDQSGLSNHPNMSTSGSLKKLLYNLQNPMVRFIVGQAKKISVANEYELSIFSEFGDVSKAVIVRNGINLEELQKNTLDFKLSFNLNDRIILFVGRFTKSKGIDTLLRAFAGLTKNLELTDVKLVIMGADFGYQKEMLELIEQLKISERTLVITNPRREEVIAAYHACDFLVLPSIWELSPLTPLEAFACRKPVISTKVHGIPYTLSDQKNSLLVEPNNSHELANSMIQLLNNKKIRDKLGSAGYQFVVETANSKSMAKNTLKIYESILHNVNKGNVLIDS